MLKLAFGTDDEARAAAARINAIHDRVHGVLSSSAGTFAEGTAYSAHDPALLAWVHVTLVHMNIRVYELLIAPLSAEARNRYCDEASWIAPALGIPDGRLPRSVGELDAHIDTMLSDGVIAVTETARTLAREVIYPPAPRVASPMLGLMRLVTVGLLPPLIRDGYGFSWDDARQAKLRRMAAVVRTVLRYTPPAIRHWPSARRAANDSRVRGGSSRSPGCRPGLTSEPGP